MSMSELSTHPLARFLLLSFSGATTAEESAEAIAENVMQVATTGNGELSIQAMKKYIQYCKARCSPRLTEEAGEVLASSYVKIRDDVRKQSIDTAGGDDSGQSAIPITVRQLEALVRLSESLAKMRLDEDVKAEDVAEALRLFKVSTMAANAADQNMSGGMGLGGGGEASHQELQRTEDFLRARMNLGSTVNRQRLIEEAAGQGFNAVIVARVFGALIMRGEVMERNSGRLLKRVK